jgi:hypothetical protein
MKTEESKLEAQREQLDIPVVMHSIVFKMVYEAYIAGIEFHKNNGDSITEEELHKRDLDFQNLYNGMLSKYCA